jgi:hypothetical protein
MAIYSGEVVGPLAGLALGGLDLEAQLLAQRAADEAAHAVGLPAGGFLEGLECGALGAEEKLPWRAGAACRSWVAAFLGRAAFGAPWAPGSPTVAAVGAGARRWMAFQRRAMAVLRSVNLRTGFRSSNGTTPAKPFQISTSWPTASELEASSASEVTAKRGSLSPAAATACLASDTVG